MQVLRYNHVPVATNSIYLCPANFEEEYADMPGCTIPSRPELTLMTVPSGFRGSGWLFIQAVTVLCKPSTFTC